MDDFLGKGREEPVRNPLEVELADLDAALGNRDRLSAEYVAELERQREEVRRELDQEHMVDKGPVEVGKVQLGKREYLVCYVQRENNWSAFAPGVPRCVAAADTREETEILFREVLEMHLENLREEGWDEHNTVTEFLVNQAMNFVENATRVMYRELGNEPWRPEDLTGKLESLEQSVLRLRNMLEAGDYIPPAPPRPAA